MKLGFTFDALVEIEKSRAVGTIAVGRVDTIGKARAIDTRQAEIRLPQRVRRRTKSAQSLVVIEIEKPCGSSVGKNPPVIVRVRKRD